MQEHAVHTVTTPTVTARPQEPTDERGYTATFYFRDGSELIIAVIDAVAFSCGGGDGKTRLDLLGPDGRVIIRGNLAALLRRAGLA